MKNKLFYSLTFVLLVVALGIAFVMSDGNVAPTPTVAPAAPPPPQQDESFKNFKIP